MRKWKPEYLPFTLGSPALIWQILFFYLPLALVLCSSFLLFSPEGVIHLTFNHLLSCITSSYIHVILSSIALALGNVFLCFLIAYPLAYFMAFRGKVVKNLLLFLLIIPFWTNFLLHVYAWFFVLEKGGILSSLLFHLGITKTLVSFMNSTFATMVMMVYYYLPFMVLPIYSSLEKFDIHLIESSLDLGASWAQTFQRIILPLSRTGIRAGVFLVYIPSFGEFAIPELMGGDKQMFVGSVISRFILGNNTAFLGSAFTVIACGFLLISSFGLYFLVDLLLPCKGRYERKK